MQSGPGIATPHAAARAGRAAWLLPMLAVVAFAPGLWTGYTWWDDTVYIRDNPFLRSPEGLPAIWFSFQTPQYYPLTFTTYWLEYQLWGEWPTPYFVANVVLHVLTSVLLWRLLLALGVSHSVAWIVAALFAVHPLQVASVAWLAQRKNTLCGVFFVLCMLAYVRHARTGNRRDFMLSLAAFAAALLSKTAIAPLPLSLAVLDWLVLRPRDPRVILRVAPMLVMGAALGVVTMVRERIGAPHTAAMLLDPLGAAASFWLYVKNVFWPTPLPALRAAWHVEPGEILWWVPLAAFLVACAAVFFGRKWLGPIAGWGLAHFVLLLMPGMGLVPFGFTSASAVGDHFVYFALPGLLLATALGVRRICRAGLSASAYALAAKAVIVLPLACIPMTWRQVQMWRDGVTLWQTTLRHAPNSALAHVNLGAALARRGEVAEALTEYEAALTHEPRNRTARLNVAIALRDLGRLDASETRTRELLRDDTAADVYVVLGTVLLRQKRWADAADAFESAIRIRPDLAAAYGAAGEAWFEAGELDRAIARLETASTLMPLHIRVWELQAEAHFARNDEVGARKAIDRGVAALRRAGNSAAAERLATYPARRPLRGP
jgi:tetratricopeptide (TPR) repeat protein